MEKQIIAMLNRLLGIAHLCAQVIIYHFLYFSSLPLIQINSDRVLSTVHILPLCL